MDGMTHAHLALIALALGCSTFAMARRRLPWRAGAEGGAGGRIRWYLPRSTPTVPSRSVCARPRHPT